MKQPTLSDSATGAIVAAALVLFGVPLTITLSGALWGWAGNAFWFAVRAWSN